jgi:hypothetical protein
MKSLLSKKKREEDGEWEMSSAASNGLFHGVMQKRGWKEVKGD